MCVSLCRVDSLAIGSSDQLQIETAIDAARRLHHLGDGLFDRHSSLAVVLSDRRRMAARSFQFTRLRIRLGENLAGAVGLGRAKHGLVQVAHGLEPENPPSVREVAVSNGSRQSV